jgi:hypothetical protein
LADVGARLIAAAKKVWGLLALLVVVAVVMGLGGFNKRSDIFIPSDVGQEIDCGNLVFTFSGATAQHVVGGYGPSYWEVVAQGAVRNPQQEAVAPLLGDYGQFVFKEADSDQVAVPSWGMALIGGDRSRIYVVPGDPATTIAISAKMDDSFSPDSDIIFGVGDAEYTDNVVLGLGGGKKNWNKDSLAPIYLLHLRLSVLPERQP